MSEGDQNTVINTVEAIAETVGIDTGGVTSGATGAVVAAGSGALNEVTNIGGGAVDTSFNTIEQIGENLAQNVDILTSTEVDLDADYELQTGSSASYVVFNPYKPQTASLPIIYGTRTTEGKLIFQETNADPGDVLFRYYAISEGPIVSIRPTTEPSITQANGFPLDTDQFNWMWREWTGSDSGIDYTQSDIDGQFPFPGTYVNDFRQGWASDTSGTPKPVSWTTNHKLKGVAAAFHQFYYGETTNDTLNKVPKITHTVEGRSLTGNNDNPANILKDYLTNSRYGAGISSSLIDTTSFNAVRDYCDELSSGNKRFTCNIIINPQNAVVDNVKLILQSFLGQLHFRGGKYFLHADQPFSGTPVVAYDTTNIIGGIAISRGTKEQRINQAIITYFDKNNDYKPAEAIWPDPHVGSENTIRNGYLTEDGSESLVKRVSIAGCTEYNVARHIAQILVKQSRAQTSVSINTTAESADVVPGDIVTLTWDALSYSAKEFRVREVSISPYGGINVKMQEHFDSFYDRDIQSEPSAVSGITTGTETIAAPTNLSATEVIYSTRDGAGVKTKVTFSWTAVSSNFLDRYIVDYKLSSASAYQPAFETGLTSVDLFDFGIGAYDLRVRARHLNGTLSTAATTTITTTGLAEPPSAVTGLFINSIGTMALLQWDLSSDLDVVQGGYYSIKHSVDTAASSWSQGVKLIDHVAGHQTSAIVPLLSGTYMIRAHDSSDQVSLATFVQSSGASLTQLATDATVTEETAFAGTKNKTVAVDDILKIVSEDQIDVVSDFDAIVRFDALSGIYNTQSAGYSSDVPRYDFANTMDLGSVKTVRLRSFIKTISESVLDLIDSRPGNVDSYTDWDDTEFDKTSIRIQVRSTNDDPSGSPTYGDYSDFYVEERTARAHQFRIFPETIDSEYNIRVQNLQVIAETLAS